MSLNTVLSKGLGHMSCEDADTTFQFQSVCSIVKTFTMNKKNVHPLLETGASENVEDVGKSVVIDITRIGHCDFISCG